MAMTKQFVKTQWNNDREPAITAEQLNRMEKGIDVNDTRIVELDKAVTAVNNELTSQSKAIGELADKIGSIKFTVTENGLLNVSMEA